MSVFKKFLLGYVGIQFIFVSLLAAIRGQFVHVEPLNTNTHYLIICGFLSFFLPFKQLYSIKNCIISIIDIHALNKHYHKNMGFQYPHKKI